MATGGVVGPIVFVVAWAVLGVVADDYSPVHDAISDLAADGRSTQWPMTAAFAVLGVGVALFGVALGRRLRRAAGAAAVLAGIATVGVAAFPLGSELRDRVHGDVATLAYAALAATPLLAVRPYLATGRRRAALLSAVAGGVTLACVAGMEWGSTFGLWQRIGLTATHAWIVVVAWTMPDESFRIIPKWRYPALRVRPRGSRG